MLACADLHCTDRIIGKRPRLPVCLDVLDQIYRTAKDTNDPVVAILGDLIDCKNRLSIDFLVSLYTWFARHRDVTWIVLQGNHEAPDKAHPEKSVLTLFSGVCHVATQPETFRAPDGNRYLLMPWRPSDVYIPTLVEASQGLSGPYTLLTHIGLREGSPNESNIQLPQNVGVEDLWRAYPWQRVFCGDYHRAQQVGSRPCYYLGAPMPHRRGEQGYGFYRVVGTDITNFKVKAPVFRRWEWGQIDAAYRTEDYNDIEVPSEHVDVARQEYPEAEVTEKPEERSGQDSEAVWNDQDPLPVLMEQYLETKGLEDGAWQTMPYGLELLRKHQNVVVS